MECTRGPGGQVFNAIVTMPLAQATGSRFKVRIDSLPSGKVSHTGLNYITDMTTDYLVAEGARYVRDSLRIVPDTGSTNVRAGARAWHDPSGVHLNLPARVQNGDGYTPPSLEFEVEITGPAGSSVSILFDRHRLTANVVVLGDLQTSCVPKPRPYALASAKILEATAQ
jgi:hypothetical protein